VESRRPFSSALLWLGLGVVLFAAGTKLALIHRYGTDQPYADQWAAEGMYLLRGPLYYQVDFTQVISPHGEHRPGLTRLWVLGLIKANGGQWDPYVELVANLLVYGAFLTLAWRWLASLIGGCALAVVAMLLAALFALPCAYENYLWGFQVHFFFLFLFGLIHVHGTVAGRQLGWRWFVAQVAGLIGLFSIAAGAMSAAALALLAVVELLRGRRNAWVWATMAVNLGILGLGLWLLPAASVSTGTKVARLGQTVTGMAYLFSWPFAGLGWCLLLQAPWVALLVAAWRGGEQDRASGDGLLVASGLWVGGMVFAIAFGRVVNADNIGVRYYDVLLFGLCVNLLALFRVGLRQAGWRRALYGSVGAVWIGALCIGLWHHNKPEDLRNLFKFQHDQAVEQRRLVQEFLVTSDPAKLQDFENATHRFPHFQVTLDFLRDPKVPTLLPPSLTPDGRAGPLSRLAVRLAGGWWLLLGAGLLCLGIGTLRAFGETRRSGHT